MFIGSTAILLPLNNTTWRKLTPGIEGEFFTNAGDTVQLRAISDYLGGNGGFSPFGNIEGKYNVKGNIMSLLYAEDFEGQTDLNGMNYAFKKLFYNCNNLVNAKDLVLPATTLADSCYSYMFYGCTSLTTAPELPATILAPSCYNGMFFGCTSLTTAPELPATTLANYCYLNMFYGCTSLTTAPELLATTLTNYCYLNMFYGCTSLTAAPELKATTLASSCYDAMFNGCTSLTIAPELPATTLANYCYAYMFYNCGNLNYIKMLATNISAGGCLSNWVKGVASSGTFVKNANMASLPNGVSGIPNGWTVENV